MQAETENADWHHEIIGYQPNPLMAPIYAFNSALIDGERIDYRATILFFQPHLHFTVHDAHVKSR
jgi:hypothetical protein